MFFLAFARLLTRWEAKKRSTTRPSFANNVSISARQTRLSSKSYEIHIIQ